MSFDANELGRMEQSFWELCEKLGARLPQEFLEWLQTTDFFTAPASAKYHLNCEGGLLCHSLNVAWNMNTLWKSFDFLQGAVSKKSAILVALFHDLCKTQTYQKSFRTQKQSDGQKALVPFYTYRAELSMGHGEKSVYLLLQHGVKLTDEEALAIRWHMGAHDCAVKGGALDLNEAKKASPLVLALQMADEIAACWDEAGL